MLNDYPYAKVKSGIHLGTRSSNWPINSFARISGEPLQGRYPAAVVVLSNNLYDIERNGPGCTVSAAQVRDWNTFNYLRDASRMGTKVIIRIEPSPGNFMDAINATLDHNLLYAPGELPAGGDYCADPFPSNANLDERGWQYFRAVDDIGREMKAIHDRNAIWGWSEYGFEPANEPNIEWYPSEDDPDVNRRRALAWLHMDLYFIYLYNYVHASYADIRVLTPPMAQLAFAEAKGLTSCEPMTLYTDPPYSGYEVMYNTYQTKNDGFTWHNYWRSDYEAWDSNFCQGENPAPPTSDHLFQYFPQSLQNVILSSDKLAFITEADLLSPCNSNPPHPITNKDTSAQAVADSLRQFVEAEQGADYVIAWLLTTSYSDTSGCAGDDEHAWHEVYRDTGTERDWFRLWWLSNE